MVEVDEAALASPGAAVGALHAAWCERRPVVVRLGVPAERFRAPESVVGDVWRLAPTLELWPTGCTSWSGPTPTTPAAASSRCGGGPARRSASGASEGGAADVVLPDGRPAWVDGGPRRPSVRRRSTGRSWCTGRRSTLGRLVADPPPVPVSAPSWRPTSSRRWPTAAGRRGSWRRPGRGKTRVLTERLRHLIVDRGFEREGVLAVAYNKRAQLELEERTTDFRPAGRDAERARPRTARHGRGCSTSATCAGSSTTSCRRGSAGPTPIRSRPTSRGSPPSVSACATPRRWRPSATTCPGLAAAFAPYRAALRRAGAVDFDEQIYGAVELLLADGELRRRTQQAHRHLLVDELQDLTPGARAAGATAGGAGPRGVRRGRRRPGHLRPRRRRPGVPHRLRPAVPGRRRPSARGELPLPGRGRRGRPPPARVQPAAGREGDPSRARGGRRCRTRWSSNGIRPSRARRRWSRPCARGSTPTAWLRRTSPSSPA